MFHAEFELTNHCNTRCLHCPHEAMSRPKGRLERKTFETVIGKIREHCAGERFSLSFSGMGEPLLHPSLFEFVKMVSSEARTSFASNGSALTEENVRRLIDAGLDQIYVSFNGDEPVVYEKMMGGLKFDRALRNLRRAIELSQGTRLTISANISVTKANRHRLTAITELLAREGITQPSYAMAHTRGGNLTDTAVVDTPAIPAEVTHCEVVRNTLFIDWRGKVLICDHDLHGDYSLGDLMTEPMAVIQERRQKLIDGGVSFKICGACNDVLKMGTDLFGDLRSGTLRDWVYDVYREDGDEGELSEATPAQRWLFQLYKKEGRGERMVNGLLKRNKLMEMIGPQWPPHAAEIDGLNRAAQQRERTIAELNGAALAHAQRIQELAQLAHDRERRLLELGDERRALKSCWLFRLLRLEQRLRCWLKGSLA